MQGTYIMLRTEEQRRYALRLLADARVDASKPSAVQFVTEGDKRTNLQNSFLWGWLAVRGAMK